MKNSERSSRQFDGVYTNKKGQKKKIRVKMHKRLAAFALSMVLVKTAGCAIIKPPTPETPNEPEQGDEFLNSDLALIERILQSNPDMLKVKTSGTYVIDYNDTLSEIAQENGITLRRLLQINGIDDAKQTIFPGQEIKIETVKELPELDKEIKILESYFYEYVFQSSFAEIAKGHTDVPQEQSALYKTMLYGYPKSEAEIDPNSIFGQYVTAYLKYNQEGKTLTDEEKQEYINTLNSIKNELLEQNFIIGLVDYDQYRVYCINGNTKSQEITEKFGTVYD